MLLAMQQLVLLERQLMLDTALMSFRSVKLERSSHLSSTLLWEYQELFNILLE